MPGPTTGVHPIGFATARTAAMLSNPRCTLADTPTDATWPALLALRAHLVSPKRPREACVFLARDGEAWRFEANLDGQRARQQVVALPLDASGLAQARAAHGGTASVVTTAVDVPTSTARPTDDCAGLPAALAIYLPIVLGTFRAACEGRVFVTGHLAQTLDGRIACHNGQSQWISNEANLRHAHRLRALHDAVLVGGRTVERDNPRLTVRHVAGHDPRRVILNGSASSLRNGRDLHLFVAPGCTILCTEAAARTAQAPPAEVRVLAVPSANGSIGAAEILRTLYSDGVGSLFVEGGGTTVSHFLRERALDVLHLHLAPILLGSGIASVSLPTVDSIGDGLRVGAEHFTLEGELLLTCAFEGSRGP